jgi:hypothetical protein
MMPLLQRTTGPNPGLSSGFFAHRGRRRSGERVTSDIEVTLVVPNIMAPKFVSFPSS